MLTAYVATHHGIETVSPEPADGLPPGAFWIDLFNPTQAEESLVEQLLTIDVPTREEMQEIEVSNRLFTEHQAVFMTGTVISRVAEATPAAGPVTFIVCRETLVTVRYTEPRPFATYAQSLLKNGGNGDTTGPLAFAGLIEAIINRLADILEAVGADLDAISREVFAAKSAANGRDFQEILRRIGRQGDLAAKARESLVSLARVTHYFNETVDLGHFTYGRDLKNRMAAVDKDIASLLDHTNFLSNHVAFHLNASLGLINIEQNAIIKLFSVVSVALMPPTLIASIYGMNFKAMPELDWPLGYPYALALMVISAVLPFWYFKKRGWF